jgi:hypothetical protein
VAGYLGTREGTVLTEADLRRARRRLEALPSRAGGGLSYVPVRDGWARIDVALREKPLWSLGSSAWATAAMQAVVERTVRIECAAPLGLAETWSARWRWWENRPLLAADVRLPTRIGIWRLGATREEQDVRSSGTLQHFDRRWATLECSQWASGSLRWIASSTWTHWQAGGSDVGVRGGFETRTWADRWTVRADASQSWSLRNAPPYATAGIVTSWKSAAAAPRHFV